VTATPTIPVRLIECATCGVRYDDNLSGERGRHEGTLTHRQVDAARRVAACVERMGRTLPMFGLGDPGQVALVASRISHLDADSFALIGEAAVRAFLTPRDGCRWCRTTAPLNAGTSALLGPPCSTCATRFAGNLAARVAAPKRGAAKRKTSARKRGRASGFVKANDGSRWEGVLVVEGVPTGDGRQFAPNALRWQNLPLPLTFQPPSHGGVSTDGFVVGRIEKIWREGNEIHGSGTFDLADPQAANIARQVREGFMRGVSVDVDDVPDSAVEAVFPEGAGGDLGDPLMGLFGPPPELVIFHDARIRSAAIVPIPAFIEAEVHVTAGAGPVRPPASWFADPKLVGPTPLTVLDTGRIFGHAATWGTCHIAYTNECVTPPYEDGYSHFLTGELVCDDDQRVAVGQITMGTTHAPLTVEAAQAAGHYDNTGLAVADVHVGTDEHGIWVAGALRPHVTDAQARELRGAALSGDWRMIGQPGLGGQLRLISLLAVNAPGFPVPRPNARVASGAPQAAVALGVVRRPGWQPRRLTEAEARERLAVSIYRRPR
jgi:hypothetical protein